MRVLFFLLFLTLPAIAGAQGTEVAFGTMKQDTSQPVEITADSLSVSQKDGSALFSGNVVIGQGEMRLSAPRVLVFYSEDNKRVERLEATGGVTLVNGDQAAEAERADYQVNDGLIRMSGNVLMTQGANTLVSDSMTVDIENGTARMLGRVKTVLDAGKE